MTDEKKTLKFQMMMSPQEAELLDDWMFKNRLRSRAEAIRRLCQIALRVESYMDVIGRDQQRFHDNLPAFVHAAREDADPWETRAALASLMHQTWETFAIWDQIWMSSEIWKNADKTDFEEMTREVERVIRTLEGKDDERSKTEP